MASQVLPTSDLRSVAREVHRDIDHRTKWARGGIAAPGKKCPHGFEEECTCNDRPMPKSNPGRRVEKLRNQRAMNKVSSTTKTTIRRDLNADDLFGPVSDSSAEEDIRETSAAPEPPADAEVMYSYDAPNGPGKGSQILSLAITKAVERFENKETEKIAKEYEFVDGKDNDADTEYSAEDDFEIVEHHNM